MRRLLHVLLFAALCFLMGCSAANVGAGPQTKYEDFREIPGVTQEEISAVEQLLAQRPSLVYGFGVTAEAFLRADGSVGGFTKLFGQRMTDLFGFEFIFLACNWDELVDRVASQEIDLAGDFTPTEGQMTQFFTTDAIAQRAIKIFSHEDADSLSEIARSRPVRCAFLRDSLTYAAVAKTMEIPFRFIFVDDQMEIPALLERGEIDAFIEEGVLEAAFEGYDFITAEDYHPLTFASVSLTTGNPELAPLISVMQKYLGSGGAQEIAELYKQGYQDYLMHRVSAQLTQEERDYILRHSAAGKVIPVACETDNYPSSFYNTKEGEFQGIAVDVLKQVAQLTGLNFQISNGTNALWPELLEGLVRGEYAVVTDLILTPQRKDRFLWAEKPSFTDSYAMISRADYPDADVNQILSSKVGLLKDSAYAEAFLSWFPSSVNVVTYDSVDRAFFALEHGEIDLLMASQNLLLYLTNYLEKPDFKANIIFNATSDSFLGFHRDEEILHSIVDKAMRYIDTQETAERWQQKTFDYQSRMLKDMVPYLVLFVTILSVGLFAVVFLLMKNRRMSKNLERLVEQRTNELALQTATLTTVFDSIPDIVFCKDLDLCFTRCNRSFETYFGRAEGEILGKDDSGLGIPEEDARAFREFDRVVMQERRTVAIEEIIPAPDGAMRLFETVKTPLMQNDTVVGLVGISRDITQRKAAEETLKLTLDNLNTCIYINEIETGKILFINDKMVKEFGSGDYYGKVCWEVFQQGLKGPCAHCPIPKLLESGDDYFIWEERNTITGRYYKNMDSLIRWHDGRLVHMQHSVDITESVQLQRELAHASKAKSDFLSRMSHEIRTPLNAIIGMNNIALSTSDPTKIRYCYERIDTASKHLLGLINDVLDMSKIEADKFELSHSEFDFEKMLMNITNVINVRADEKKQNLVVNLNSNVPSCIISDELRLSQVITNLLTNAVKFTPEKGTIVLTVEQICEEGTDLTLRVEVADNGIGISEEQQKRLFSSFEQADGSISRRFGGTGLGLAISKRIVELMGGRIWIESELGKGSRFLFTIQVSRGSGSVGARLSPALSREELRILAVDDCAETREYFGHVMDAHRLSCDVAASGAEALELIRACGGASYSIFFVDWQMPEMNGIELTRKIKEVTGENTVVIMISVGDWNQIEQEARSAGVKQFIPKPLFPSALIDAINECVGKDYRRTAPEGRENASSEALRSLEGYTALVAEDVEINREIMAAVLEDTGLTIQFAENGKIAVRLFREQPSRYDLILMDIQMPEMDGFEATRRIRELDLDWGKHVPIVAMTANVFREDIENCLAAGMNDHVGKPIDQNDLFNKLYQYLPRREQAGTAAPPNE